MACLMRGGSGRFECHQHDSAWHVQGYFYWWVIVSMVWGLIAAFIAIVMPVWEVRPVATTCVQIFLVRLMHACLVCSFNRALEPRNMVYNLCESVRAGKGHNRPHHHAHAHLPVCSPLGRVPEEGVPEHHLSNLDESFLIDI